MGKGFRNDLLDDLLPGADKRTYWQMPLYPFALSLWGKIWGFELNALRWFSRIAGVITLFLLFSLALRLSLPPWLSFFCVLWTATDLSFQFAANFARPDVLCCGFLLAALICSPFNSSGGLSIPLLWSLAAGTFFAAAVFTHPLAFPPWLLTLTLLALRHGKSKALIFSVPFSLVGMAWLAYVLQDFPTFLAQIQAHFAHKRYTLIHYLAFLMGTPFWGIEAYLGVPVNPMPWVIPFAVAMRVITQRRWFLPPWFLAFVAVTYFVVTVGAEAWYPPVFVPLGYLFLAALLSHFYRADRSPSLRLFPLFLATSWWGYQVSVVVRHWAAVPSIRREVKAFEGEVERLLPPGAVVVIGSFSPDPTFSLLSRRPDLRLYQLMPLPMVDPKGWRELRERATHFLILRRLQGVLHVPGKTLRVWQFRLGGMASLKRWRDNPIVLLERTSPIRPRSKSVSATHRSKTALDP